MVTQTLPPFDFGSTFRDGNPYPAYARYRGSEPVHVVREAAVNGSDGGTGVYLFGHAVHEMAPRSTPWTRLASA